jgi:flavin reductase (DIM6/NTAB) family NADH-FMN oxidoreductase RutF
VTHRTAVAGGRRPAAARVEPVPTGGLATNQDLDPVRLRQAFGVFPSGVVAVAAEVDGALVGLAASSFTSVSLDPPLVSFSVARTSKTWPDLRRADHVGVTVLAEQHGDVCRQLAGPVDARFDDVPVRVSDHGAVLLDEGLARFECSIYREVEAGDHVLVLLRLHAVEHDPEEQVPGSPLVFHRSTFGRLSRPKVTPDARPNQRENR